MHNHNTDFDSEQIKIADTISKIKHRIAVFSGKGGVGKTTISVNLAFALQAEGLSTGILDADITSPNVPKMLNLTSELIHFEDRIIPFEKFGVKVISMASLLKKGQPLIWRGPMRSKIINQFLSDVEWGELEYLIADLPPGTGDEILTIAQEMKPEMAVVVTTPQDVSLMDAERAVNMAKQLNIPYIGIIENMAGLICPHCTKVIDLFGNGGGKKLADELNVHFLGSLPFEVETRKLSDEGRPVVTTQTRSIISENIRTIAKNIDLYFHHNKKFKIENILNNK